MEALPIHHVKGDNCYCLDGGFNRDCFGIDYMGKLKGMHVPLQLVKPIGATVNGVTTNMSVVVAIIKDDIHSSLQLLEDLALLLDTLRQYNIGDSLLVQTHFCHEEEDNKTALFDRMHKRLKVIEKTDAAKYTRIMQTIQPPGVSVWLASAMDNTHLHCCVLRYAP
jgi:hypothetical protein